MANVSVRLQPEYVETLDAEAEQHDMSRAEYIRQLIERGRDSTPTPPEHKPEHTAEHDELRAEYEQQITEYEDQIADLERENDRLNRERRQLLDQRDEHTELVRYAEDQREDEQRRREIKQHNVFRRAWWWVAGEPTSEIDN